MLSKEDKQGITQHLLKQKEFLNSPTSRVLLEYLVDATLSEKDIKETTIGVDLLGDKFQAEKGNARIRVNIYNLRKKLEHYYANDGKDNPWKIRIAKGQYHVQFIRNKSIRPTVGKKEYLIGGLVTALLFSWILFFFLTQTPSQPNLWKPFFSNGKPTTLVIGDSFGIMGPTPTGKTGWFRDYEINSLEELYLLMDEHPELKTDLWPANYYYTTGMAAYAAKELTTLFQQQNADFSIRFSSNSVYSDIIESNSIYAGPIKNDNKFIRFFNESNREFQIDDGYLYYSGEKDTTFQLTMEGIEFEYALVSRLAGPNNTEQFIFFSDHDIGVKATIEYFTNPDSIKAFSDRYLYNDGVNFTALFETWGIERNNINLKPILVRPVKQP